MIETELEIVNKLGLHARAAARFVTCASAYTSQIQVSKDGRRVNGKSIMGVMMLAASQGSRVRLEIDGDDEAAACKALTQLIADRFGEGE
ncbi:HPr family phosphocarrier protein [Thioalkalicoccus limnaeus]|uniref:HPr family phosphocarrier protein n=1 Tax=Thioalkalicoccus limnaeus TaxID=120681 RepID=A0ABV4BH40_9GAMM